MLACPATWRPEHVVSNAADWHVVYVVLATAVEDKVAVEDGVVADATPHEATVTPVLIAVWQVKPGQHPL